MVETDPTVALAVEGMDARAYGDYLAGRQIAVASLSMVQKDYPAKKLLLEQAVKAEKAATDVLRSVTLLTVTEGAEGENCLFPRTCCWWNSICRTCGQVSKYLLMPDL